MTTVNEGQLHLAWIARFQLALLGAGTLLWLLRSKSAAGAFLLTGVLSVAFWHLHSFLVGRMLTPSVRRRWFYAVLVVGKLALLTFGARAIMTCFPTETIPFTAGILLFIGGILLEAGRLVIQPGPEGE